MASPSRSHQRILSRLPARLRKTNRCPEYGSNVSLSRMIAKSPSKPRRMSVGAVATYTRVEGGRLSIGVPPTKRSGWRAVADRIHGGREDVDRCEGRSRWVTQVWRWVVLRVN